LRPPARGARLLRKRGKADFTENTHTTREQSLETSGSS
jgi:hypothetical protein